MLTNKLRYDTILKWKTNSMVLHDDIFQNICLFSDIGSASNLDTAVIGFNRSDYKNSHHAPERT